MKRVFIAIVSLFVVSVVAFAHTWTLQECIDYALQHNTDIRKSVISKLKYQEDIKQYKSALLPSLTGTTSQNVTYRPWTSSGSSVVANGQAVSSVDKVYYNGSYGINSNWVLWNGNKNWNNVKLYKLNEKAQELDSIVYAHNLYEQITKLYIQILYSKEAIGVMKKSLEKSKKNEERGQAMLDVGNMSKADLAQLTAQRAQDEYNVVAAESTMKNFKRQLKELLQIADSEPFDVIAPEMTDEMALRAIPNVDMVFASAMEQRPEIKKAETDIDISNMKIKIARAGHMPTLSFNASTITNTTSMKNDKWGSQMKTNFNLGAGLSLSIPIFDNRSTKTAIRKALLDKQSSIIALENERTAIYSDIENYWLEATNNQDKYKAAKVSSESYEESYKLLSEQFELGLKNIVELMTGKYNLLNAQQTELQSKYLAIYNISMLEFYQDGAINTENYGKK